MEEDTIKKSQGYCIKEGAAWSVSNGLGPAYISPYALAMGANPVQIGLLTSIPNLAANLSEIRAPRLMERVSRKRIVNTGVVLEMLILVPIALIAPLYLFFDIGSLVAPSLVIIFYTLFLTIGAFTYPPWASWVGDIVPEKQRGRFFSKRSSVIGVASISAMLVGGVFLNFLRADQALLGFAALFLAAVCARAFSFYFLRKQYEPKFVYRDEFYFGFGSFVRRMKDNNFGRFSLYVALMIFSLNLASPFFAVYMLKELHFSYLTFVSVVLSASVAEVLSVRFWGRFADSYGNFRILRICGLVVPVLPVLWIFSGEPLYLVAIEAFSGVIWGGFNLAATNFIYDAVTQQRRGICFSYFGALNGVGVFLGATLGGLIATYVNVGFMSILLFLFLISGVLRLAVSLAMLPHIKEVREVKEPKPLRYYVGGLIKKRLPIHPH